MEQARGLHREYKDELYAGFARIGAALGNAHRLEILDLLSQRDERTVEDLARELGTTTGSTSQHLLTLLRARLVEVRRRGTYAYYRLGGLEVNALWRQLRDVASARSAEIAAIARRHQPGDRQSSDVDVTRLLPQVERGEVLLFDARPLEEYRAGHLPGARLIPLDSLAEYVTNARLQVEREIVVYCRGPYCVYADEAVAELRGRGFTAHRLNLGVPEWRALGYAVALGDPPS